MATVPLFTSDYPGAIVFPANLDNVYSPAGHGGVPNKPRAFILHTPEEPADNYPSTPNWFAQYHPDSRGSTHYFVSFTGKVYQCLPEAWGAIANGFDPGNPQRLSYPSWAGSFSLNWQTLSVEIEGYADSVGASLKVGSVQWVALINLIKHRCAAWGIPLTREFIMGHYQLSVNRRDPGAGFPWAALMADLGEEDMSNYYTKEEVDGKVGALLRLGITQGGQIAAIAGALSDHVQNHGSTAVSANEAVIRQLIDDLAQAQAELEDRINRAGDILNG